METEESKGNYGYCDLHLESKLVFGGSWIAGQYGGDKADCNPFRYWRCSRPECNRCYAPDIFGYFDLDRQRGGRIQPNTQTQEKCGRHADTPFMVIGKCGKGRRFRCPYPDCDNVGPVLADYVADVDYPEEAQPAAMGLTNAAEKELFELSTFSEFAKAANLPVRSPENAKPPQPDIRCLIDGNEYWFELGRITDSNLAKTIASRYPTDPKPFSFAQNEPFVRIIEKKAAAKYQTGGRPLDLVLHFDQQPPDRVALERHLHEHATALEDLRQRGPFSRIWIYDGWSKSVMWKSGD